MRGGKKYATPAALRRAIVDRLRTIAITEGTDIERLRRHVVFERLLSRLFSIPNPPWILKGGYVMEIRLQSNRGTKDIDLAVSEQQMSLLNCDSLVADIYNKFTKAMAKDMGDFFVFNVKKTRKLFGPPQGGIRFYISATLDSRIFSNFHVDVGVGDAEVLPIVKLPSMDLLAFADIYCPQLPSIPQEQHFAEKIHAYTTLRNGHMSSRVKDLVDMVLLIQRGSLNKTKLAKVLRLTFGNYKNHPLPQQLPAPPTTWREKFTQLAGECGLKIGLEDAYALVKDFYSQIKF